MDNLIAPLLVVAIRDLPIVVSLIKDNKLTTPIALTETTAGEIKVSPYSLATALGERHPSELKLTAMINCHCEKGVYLLQEGELRCFTISQGPLAMKRIMDCIRDLGWGLQVKTYLLNLLVSDDNGHEWLDV